MRNPTTQQSRPRQGARAMARVHGDAAVVGAEVRCAVPHMVRSGVEALSDKNFPLAVPLTRTAGGPA